MYPLDETVFCEQEPLTLWQNLKAIYEGVSYLIA